MQKKRTTVTAGTESLATLEAEAARRNVSLSQILAEAVDEKAMALRAGRRPSIGVARSEDGRSAAEVTAEPVARPPK